MDYTRLVFVVAYIIIDLVYVVLSKPVYDLVVKSIQGEFMRPLSGIGSALPSSVHTLVWHWGGTF